MPTLCRFKPTSVPAALLGVVVLTSLSCDDPVHAPPTLAPPDMLRALRPVENDWDLDAQWAQIARDSIPGFAGYYRSEAGEYVAAVAGGSPAQPVEDFVRRRLQERGKAGTVVQIRSVEYDFDSLNGWKDELVRLLDGESVYWIDIDELGNRIVLGVASSETEARIRAFADSAGIPDVLVVVETTKPANRSHSLGSRVRPVVGGLRIEADDGSGGYVPCTLGANAYSYTTLGFVTASHCPETSVFSLDGVVQYQSVFGEANHRISQEVKDPSSNRTSDAAFYEYDIDSDSVRWGHIARTLYLSTDPGQDGSTVIDTAQPWFRIVSEESNSAQVVGEIVDKMGAVSGWTRGHVTQTCVTLYGLPCQWVAALRSRKGDSGSPIFQKDGDKARLFGILWGGPPPDVWDTTFYSPVANVEADLGSLHFACPPPSTGPCDPPLFADLAGPEYIDTTGVYTWTASGVGGNGSYSYVWEYRIKHSEPSSPACDVETQWSQVGTGATYQRSVTVPDYNFELNAWVTSGTQTKVAWTRVILSAHPDCPF